MLKLFGYVSLLLELACPTFNINTSLFYTNLQLKFVFALVIPISMSFAFMENILYKNFSTSYRAIYIVLSHMCEINNIDI